MKRIQTLPFFVALPECRAARDQAPDRPEGFDFDLIEIKERHIAMEAWMQLKDHRRQQTGTVSVTVAGKKLGS